MDVVHGRSGATGIAESAHRTAPTGRRAPVDRKIEREAQYFSDETPDYENESQESVEIKQGTYVRHEMFGRGKVIRVTGKGDAMKVVVDFEDFGIKNLLVRFARLRSG
jgi:DNA helicase-2/ATP-dependent DNA helicase PcrA